MSLEIKEQKKGLRTKMLKQRNVLDAAYKLTYDELICHHLFELALHNNYKTVHAYLPFLSEINITPLITNLLKENITVVCPKTLPKRQLENRVLDNINHIEVGIKGTLHPANTDIYNGSYDLIIVPGLAFDEEKYRLGYGGGYYDNFLLNQPQAFKVGIFYPFQQVEHVPTEAHDVKLDQILTFK